MPDEMLLGFHRDPDELSRKERGDVTWAYASDPNWNKPGLLIRHTDLRSRWLIARDRGKDESGLIETFIAWAIEKRKRWAWDGLAALFFELRERREPIPDQLQEWANVVAYASLKGTLKAPPKDKNPAFANQDERDLRIYYCFRWFTQGAIGRRQALHEIGQALDMPESTVENAVTKWSRHARAD